MISKPVNPIEKTMENMMKDAGYKTVFFGEDQLGWSRSFEFIGFDSYCIYQPQKTDS